MASPWFTSVPYKHFTSLWTPKHALHLPAQKSFFSSPPISDQYVISLLKFNELCNKKSNRVHVVRSLAAAFSSRIKTLQQLPVMFFKSVTRPTWSSNMRRLHKHITTDVIQISLSLSLSVSNAIFTGGPGLADTRMSPLWILFELRMMVLVTTGAVRCAKHIITHIHISTYSDISTYSHFHDFPGNRPDSRTLQAWKMWLINSKAFQDL